MSFNDLVCDIPGRPELYRIIDAIYWYSSDNDVTYCVVDGTGVKHYIPAVGVNGTILRLEPRRDI